MAIKALVYIILTVASIVIAVALFVKLWSVFVPDDATGQDLDLLRERIELLTNDDAKYKQEAFILQAQEYVIFAFDTSTQSIDLALENSARKKLRLTKPDTCKDKACLCKVKHDSLEGKGDETKLTELLIPPSDCTQVSLPKEQVVYFGTDYAAYRTYISNHVDEVMNIQPKILQPKREGPLATDLKYRNAVISSQFRTTTTVEPRPIMPLVLEKSTVSVQGKEYTVILLLQDTALARSRYLYLQQCTGKNTPQECMKQPSQTGKTPYESFSDLNKEKYCSINPFTGACTVQAVPTCPKDTPINYPCNCNNELISQGVCLAQDCTQIHECSDYCLIRTGTQTASINCNPEELSLCAQDICDVAKTKQYQIRCVPSGGEALSCAESPR